MNNTSAYLYAVIPRSQDGTYSPHGVQGFPVSLCSQGDLSAAISFGPLGLADKDRGAHRRVMRQLLTHAAVFPAPEPTILPDWAAVQDMLTERQGRMLEQLRRVQGLIEIRLQVFTRCAASPPPQVTANSAAVADARAYLLARHTRALRSGGFIVRALPLHHAQAMLHLACLLPWASRELFVLNCKALRSRLDPAYELSISEPMAAVDFVNPQLFQSHDIPHAARVGAAAAHVTLS